MAKVEIEFVANEKDVIDAAKKIDESTKQLAARLQAAGVSQSAYNKAMAEAKTRFEQEAIAADKATKELEQKRNVMAQLSTIATGVNSVFSTASMIYGQVAGQVRAVWGEYSQLSEQIRDLSLVSGTSAEETSRFIQVLDDYQLTAEDATTAARFLKEKGLSPTIDTLVQLSNQFKAIEDPAKRLEFIQENLGRGGAKWINVLNQEGDALRAAAAGIDKHLIMSDEQIAKYEQQRLALDAYNDSIAASKVAVGSWFGELVLTNQAMIRANEIYKANGGVLTVGSQQTKEYKDALEQARAEQEAQTKAMMDSSDAAAQNEAAMEDLIAKQKQLSEHLSGQVSLIGQIQAADERFTAQSQDLADQRTETEAQLAELRRQGYSEQSTQIQDQLSKLDEIKQKEIELGEERARQSLQFVSNILAEQLARDGWTQTEFDAFAKQQEAWGLWSAEAVKASQAAWQEADKITASINAIPTSKTVTIALQTIASTMASAGGQQYYQSERGRDSGGYGEAGQAYLIGRGAQPEAFIPNTNGTFIPNADRMMGGGWDDSRIIAAIESNRMSESKMAKLMRDSLAQVFQR